jgi:hypothetical protein
MRPSKTHGWIDDPTNVYFPSSVSPRWPPLRRAGATRMDLMIRGLAILLVSVTLGGCIVGETNQPLPVVDQKPAASATGGAGNTSASGTTGSAGQPTGTAGTGAGAAGAGATALGGSGGGSSAEASGAEYQSGAAGKGVATPCWASGLPPEPQAPQPKLTVADACQRGANATSWTFPTTSSGAGGAGWNEDNNGDIVGRWVACGRATVVSEPHAGIEFAGNGRWRLLGKDASGDLVPLAPAGYYYLVGGGLLNLEGESPPGAWGGDNFVTFADGNRDVVRFLMSGGIYARVAPSATNGDDNAPSVSDGHCSMVGSWNVPGNAFVPASRWSFDDAGYFVIDSPSDDLCAPHMQWGTYQLSSGFFEINQNWNLGACGWDFTAAYPYQFSGDCSTLTLTTQWDNCTGGRGYLDGTANLMRRK